jgi:hypothetical protein
MKNAGLVGFRENALKVHGDKFDYSKSFYVNSKTPLTIICPIHGEYTQTPYVHLITHGCPKCGRINTEKSHIHDFKSFLIKCNTKFKNKYSYIFQGDNFIAQTSLLDIKCSCGNSFTMKGRDHLFSKSGGCKKCQYSSNVEKSSKPLTYAKSLLEKHFPTLKLVESDYINMSTECEVECPKHGIYKTKPYNFQYGHGGCPNCSYPSNLEKTIQDFLESKNISFNKNDRTVIKPNEIDFLIKNIGIETCGLYWHSDAIIDNDYHYKKYLKCLEKNIKLLQFFEDEILGKKEIVFSMILNRLGKASKIYARKCIVKEITNKEKKNFLNENHLQGDCVSSINLGLELNGEILSVMTFGKPRLNLGNKSAGCDEYELIRFANKLNTTVIGGASKLFSFFIKNHSPKKVISYCDLRHSTGELYLKLGFTKVKISKPNYFYFKSSYGIKRHNRFSFRKSLLSKLLNNFDPTKTEKQNMKDNGFLRIYDCGSMKFEWNKKIS